MCPCTSSVCASEESFPRARSRLLDSRQDGWSSRSRSRTRTALRRSIWSDPTWATIFRVRSDTLSEVRHLRWTSVVRKREDKDRRCEGGVKEVVGQEHVNYRVPGSQSVEEEYGKGARVSGT